MVVTLIVLLCVFVLVAFAVLLYKGSCQQRLRNLSHYVMVGEVACGKCNYCSTILAVVAATQPTVSPIYVWGQTPESRGVIFQVTGLEIKNVQ